MQGANMNDTLALANRLDSVEKRIYIIEEKNASLALDQHDMDKQLVEIRSDLRYIKSGQDSINSNLARVLWIFAGGFIAAIVGFIVNGGLNVVI
jgi:hypothetical protein